MNIIKKLKKYSLLSEIAECDSDYENLIKGINDTRKNISYKDDEFKVKDWDYIVNFKRNKGRRYAEPVKIYTSFGLYKNTTTDVRFKKQEVVEIESTYDIERFTLKGKDVCFGNLALCFDELDRLAYKLKKIKNLRDDIWGIEHRYNRLNNELSNLKGD